MSPDKVSDFTTTGRRPRYFYGWNIVAAAFLAHLSYAEQFSSMLGFFFKPLQSQFGWSRSLIAAVQSIARVTEALMAPLVGPLIDRYGPRVLMPIGAIIVSLTMLAVTQMTAIWHFYLLRGVMAAVGYTFMGALVTDVAINNWFIRKRGRAVAIERLGNHLSNVIFIPVTVFVLAVSGWQMMFVIFAVVTLLVVLIPSIIIMRRRPEDMGLYPDGDRPSSTVADINQEESALHHGGTTPDAEPLWNRREVLKNGSFWMLTVCFGISSMAFQGINISLAPYIQDLGYGDAMLATIMTFRSVVMVVTVPLMGFLAERAYRRSVRIMPFAIQGIACVLFLMAGQPGFLWLAVATYGMGISGISIIQEVLWANYFGRLNLGLVRSLGFLVAFGLGASGPVAMNIAFDVLGSYRLAFITIIGLFVVSAFIMWVIRPPQAHRYATAADLAAYV